MLQWCNSSREITKQHDARAKLLFVNTNILIFTDLLAVAVSVGFGHSATMVTRCHTSPLYWPL